MVIGGVNQPDVVDFHNEDQHHFYLNQYLDIDPFVRPYQEYFNPGLHPHQPQH